MNNSKIIQKLTITILLSAIFFKPEKVFATTPIGGFNDEETSENNSMETSTLDMEMRSPTEDFSPNVDLYLEDTAERTIEIENVRELGFLYSLEITGITGDTEFCEDLELEVYRDSTKLFNGTLGHFFLNLGGSDNYYFLENTDGTHEYLFSITIPDNDDPDLSDKSCDFDIEAVAWMENLGPYTGFWDEEVLSNSVSTSDWLMEMGYETAETQADDSDGNPILGLCNVVTEDKSQNSNQSALQILKWSQMEGADSYQITGYKLDSSNNWVKQGSAYNPADYSTKLSFDDTEKVYTYTTWASNEGTYAYYIEGLNSDGDVIGKTLPEDDDFTCTFTVQWPQEGDVVINEIMWGGSSEHELDRWIELRNMTGGEIDLTGWTITEAGPGPHNITLTGKIPANGYYLIANFETDHTNGSNSFAAINDSIDADLVIGLGGGGPDNKGILQFKHEGEKLVLKDPSGMSIDETPDVSPGVGWAAGSEGSPGASGTDKWRSMERNDTPGDGSLSGSWHSCMDDLCNDTAYWDTEGDDYGTPKSANRSENDPTSEDYKEPEEVEEKIVEKPDTEVIATALTEPEEIIQEPAQEETDTETEEEKVEVGEEEEGVKTEDEAIPTPAAEEGEEENKEGEKEGGDATESTDIDKIAPEDEDNAEESAPNASEPEGGSDE